MIVRASPNAKGVQDPPDWPPRSPFHARLLSSPTGRRKCQDHRNGAVDRSPSPSPARKPVTSSKTLQALARHEPATDHEDTTDDEDEETLKLQLQAIEARLKLKKLQAKARKPLVKGHSLQDSDGDRQIKRRKVTPDDVQVPVSPQRKPQPPKQHRSPARVLLGLDKGDQASNVSLKRPSNAPPTSPHHANHDIRPKIKSFSERMAESRAFDHAREAKIDRVGQSRATGFNLKFVLPDKINSPSHDSTDRSDNKEDGSFESYSSLHLSKRHIQHTDLTRLLEEKEIYTLPRLLKDVKAPYYEPPDCETDYVVFGILASKSSPYNAKSHAHATADPNTDESMDPNKFMVLKLVDLDWEVDLFLFSTAFTQHWKLTPGTLLAILNPDVMPPKVAKDSGRFSLKLSSSEDQIIEVGVARDLGYCKSVKRDRQQCNSWVNKRKTEYCDFHVTMMLDKTRAGRMEINGMSKKSGLFQKLAGATGADDAKPRPSARRKDRETGEWFYTSTAPGSGGTATTRSQPPDNNHASYGQSTRQIMDAAELARPEQMRKRLQDREKEKALAARLGELGNGIGAEYLRAGTQSCAKTPQSLETGQQTEKRNASALGLVARPTNVRLSPVKRKRLDASVLEDEYEGLPRKKTKEIVGWGGAFKPGLIDGKHVITSTARLPSSALGSSRPVRKKTRLDLGDKGIKEPGRESFGDATREGQVGLEDDGDDLDIVL